MSKSFSSINRERLLEMVDDLTVLRAYTTVGKQVGNRYEVLCPLHNDKKFNSCWYYQKDRKIYCYVCHDGGNIIDVVMKRHGWTEGQQAYDAMREIAQICGIDLAKVSDNLSPEDQKKMKAMPPMPTQDELKILGLYNEPVRITSNKENDPDEYQDESYLSNPLGKLRMEDEEGFRTLIISKCKERIAEDNKTIDECQRAISRNDGDITSLMFTCRSAYEHTKLVKEIQMKYTPED